jgi:hypothetical protein
MAENTQDIYCNACDRHNNWTRPVGRYPEQKSSVQSKSLLFVEVSFFQTPIQEPIRSPDESKHGNKSTSPGASPPYQTDRPSQPRHFDVESDEIIWKCTGPYDWLGDMERDQSDLILQGAADFFLPKVSEGLSMIVQGAAGHGNLSITWSDDIDRMVVSMTATALDRGIFDKTTVCYHGNPERNSQSLLIKVSHFLSVVIYTG